MEDSFTDAIRTLERQAFVKYVTVVDKNGYSIASRGEASKSIASYVREVENCAESIFNNDKNLKILIEGTKKSVSIGQQNDFLIGVQINKELF